MEFIANNWALILGIIAIAVLVVVLAFRGKKQIIFKMLYALVTEAEAEFGAGTGTLKFSYVLERVYSILPAGIKTFITYDTLEKWIETALAEAKEKWAELANTPDEN